MLLLQLSVAILFGALMGNFATTVYYRLPINKPVNGIGRIGLKPHCSRCQHKLKFYEYLPILSWFSAPLKCNYCKKPKDITYTFIELFGILCALFFYSYIGLGIEFAVLVILSINSMLMVLFWLKYKKIFLKNISLVFTIIMGIFLTNGL